MGIIISLSPSLSSVLQTFHSPPLISFSILCLQTIISTPPLEPLSLYLLFSPSIQGKHITLLTPPGKERRSRQYISTIISSLFLHPLSYKHFNRPPPLSFYILCLTNNHITLTPSLSLYLLFSPSSVFLPCSFPLSYLFLSSFLSSQGKRITLITPPLSRFENIISQIFPFSLSLSIIFNFSVFSASHF